MSQEDNQSEEVTLSGADFAQLCDELKEFKAHNQYLQEQVGVLKHLRLPQCSPDVNVEYVRQQLLNRSEVGLKKYGVTTMRKDLTLDQWMVHLQEELLDAAVYVQAQRERMQAAEKLIKLLMSYDPNLLMDEGMKVRLLDILDCLIGS